MATETSHPVRVMVAGLGAVTSQGATQASFWDGVKNGRVAIRPVNHLPMDGYRTRIAGEVAEVPTPKHDYLRPGGFSDRAYDFALTAAEEAFDAAGIDFDAVAPERWGVVVGTCNAGLLSGAHWFRQRMNNREPDPRLVLLVPPQAIAEAIAGAYGLRGPVLSVDTACAAGANAIGYGAELIRRGQADAVVTGGTDGLSDVLLAGFNSLESLSPEPAAPYSKDRQGLSLGEGSGMLVLVRDDIAERLGAPMLAEVAGYSLSADGYHATAPHPEGFGAARAIQGALRAAGVSTADVDYVNSHGTGTSKNDPAETRATKVGLGEEDARRVAVSSTKSMVGHLLGAAGAVEGIVTVRAIEEQLAPPTANFTEADPDCDLDYVPNVNRAMTIDVAVSNNFAFGGANCSVVFRAPGAAVAAHAVPPPDRVVVTGIGALTAAGTTLEALYEAAAGGRDLTVSEDGVPLGRVDVRPGDFLTPRERKRVDRLGVFSIIAARSALTDAGIEIEEGNRERVGVILGTGVGPMESMEDFSAPLFAEGPRAANPAIFPNTVYNAAAGQVAIKVGVVGPTTTVTAGHAAGSSSLVCAYDLAAADHADVLIALGADALTDTVIAAYRGLGVLGDGSGKGFPLAEAGVALVCERHGAAAARGHIPYGEILGYGIASDGLGIGRWDPEGNGMERAMRLALEQAGLEADRIEAVYASAAGLAEADEPEAGAIRRVFGDGAEVVEVKRRLGEPMGAGGSLCAALALEAFRRGDRVNPVVVNSSSLGGTHFAVVLGPAGG
ncbi:MAG: beta-ketoacyl-[acyl-carrier-protein] synthase family protein [Egibacteraceae bacterium]